VKNQFSTPDAAEQAFYRALHEKDIQAMSEVWVDSDAIACIHPMGARLQGRQEVMTSWQQIFSSASTLAFQLKDIRRQRSGSLAVHLLHEYITPDDLKEKVTIVVTTNVYELIGGAGWRMILHHASLSPKTVAGRKADDNQQKNVLH